MTCENLCQEITARSPRVGFPQDCLQCACREIDGSLSESRSPSSLSSPTPLLPERQCVNMHRINIACKKKIIGYILLLDTHILFTFLFFILLLVAVLD